MKDVITKKLCLGTAQFGFDYGIANVNGKIARNEVFQILEFAHNSGIDTLDTAHSYGESEKTIGDFISGSGLSFNIISKLPQLGDNGIAGIESICLETLDRLRRNKIYGYLVHKSSDIAAYKEGLWSALESMKEKGVIEKIGFSINRVEDLNYLLDNRISFDIIQIPYNLFDQRFKEKMPKLKEKGIEVHTRSIFLQGLFFIDMDAIEKNFQPAMDSMEKLRNISRESRIPIQALCICFAMLNSSIDKVIIGVDSLEQLKENIASLEYMDEVKDMHGLLESIKFHDEEVILPCNWKI
ncbi:MAG: aldo/keto reductase [Candidatus Omnitrophica bacterium]|nr:aldo/keto reductase [Candidatus Omnitrophota bacterium]